MHWILKALKQSVCLSKWANTSLYFAFLAVYLARRWGVIGMQASAGQLDEPGPELGHKAQRLCCAHKISLKQWFSNRLRPVQFHWCHPSLRIHFSGTTTEPRYHTPPPTHRKVQRRYREFQKILAQMIQVFNTDPDAAIGLKLSIYWATGRHVLMQPSLWPKTEIKILKRSLSFKKYNKLFQGCCDEFEPFIMIMVAEIKMYPDVSIKRSKPHWKTTGVWSGNRGQDWLTPVQLCEQLELT